MTNSRAKQDDLDQLRRQFQGCEVALLADIEAGLCLHASCAVELGQAELSEICARAGQILHGDDEAPEVLAILSGPLSSTIFLRESPAHTETLCMVFGPSEDICGATLAGSEFLMNAFPRGHDDRQA